ncbi:hypothetical protein [Flavobacterium sp. 3HN19-14]|uniref:hypothetical protein n=1 Tax=Flavobacterium sp. 3HN19-14 TaxID=3448133 RepID=UPI003EDEEA3F
MKKLFTIAMIFGLSTFGWAENGSGIGDIPVTNGTSYTKEVKTTTVKKVTKTAIVGKAKATKATKATAKKGGYYTEEITITRLPKFTRQYIRENFSMRQVRSVSKEISGNGIGYQVKVSLDGEMNTMRFDSKGEPTLESL